MSQIIDLGKLRFTYTGVYSNVTTYEFNDVVSYGGNLYHYKFATSASGNIPTNTVYWNQILKGFNFRGTWSSSANYLVGDVVSFGAKTFLTILDAPITTAPTNTTYFSLLTDGMQFEGEYSALSTYQKGDVVSYGGSAYIATANTTVGNAPTDTAFWALLVEGAFPNQTGNADSLLTTNGTSASWTDSPTLLAADISTLSVDTKFTVSTEEATFIGTDAETWSTNTAELTQPAAVFRYDGAPSQSSFAQLAFNNSDPTSSTDIIVYMDNGNDSYGWVGMGIAGSLFDDTTYGITGPGDAYIFHDTLDDSYTGNLVLATGASGAENKIIFAAGGFDSGLTQMEITPGVNVHIEIPTPSISPTTGALTVVGGVGVQGDMNIQGQVSIVGNLTFGGGSTTTENLAVTAPLVFTGEGSLTDTLDLGIIGEYAKSVTPVSATVTNKALTNNIATLTTSAAHTFVEGDVVTITNVDATFNGTYSVKTAPTSTTFTYAKTATNVTSAAVSPTGTAQVSASRRFAGVVRDSSDGIIKFFVDATTKPTSTVNFAEAGLSLADISVKELTTSGVITGGASSNIAINTNKFTVNATSGNTAVGGTLGVTSDVAINTNKFNVTASSGDTLIAGTLGVTGLVTVNGGINSSGTLTFTGGANFSGTTDVQELREQVVNVTLASNTGTLDWTAGNIYYIATAPTAAMTLNVTNIPTDINKIMTINVFVTQGATGYIPTTFQIAGVNQSIRWVGGTSPTPTSSAGKIDVFTFTLQRTATPAWIVYASSALNF